MNYADQTTFDLLEIRNQMTDACNNVGLPHDAIPDIHVIDMVLKIRLHKAEQQKRRKADLPAKSEQLRRQLNAAIFFGLDDK